MSPAETSASKLWLRETTRSQEDGRTLANTSLLTKVLTYHVVAGRLFKAEVPIDAPIAMVETGSVTVDANLDIADARGRKAKIVGTDTLTSNGVIHVIDKVLLPAHRGRRAARTLRTRADTTIVVTSWATPASK